MYTWSPPLTLLWCFHTDQNVLDDVSCVCSERLTVSYVTYLIYPLVFFAEGRKDMLYIAGIVCGTVFILVISLIVVLKIRKPCLQRELCSKSLNQAITGKIEILKMSPQELQRVSWSREMRERLFLRTACTNVHGIKYFWYETKTKVTGSVQVSHKGLLLSIEHPEEIRFCRNYWYTKFYQIIFFFLKQNEKIRTIQNACTGKFK